MGAAPEVFPEEVTFALASEDGRSARQGCGDRVLQAKGAGCSKAQKPYECEWGVSWAGPGAEPESTHSEYSTGLGRVLPWTQWETGKVFRQESNRICLYKKKHSVVRRMG